MYPNDRFYWILVRPNSLVVSDFRGFTWSTSRRLGKIK